MEQSEVGPMYSDIGQLVADDLDGDPEGAFLYAEVQPGVVTASIYKDLGERVIYVSPSDELFEKIAVAWEAVEPEKRWSALSYTVSNNRFSASFQFLEELNPEETHDERRERILNKKYGDKLIDYSKG